MPNFSVFQIDPSTLRARIFGLNGTTDVAVSVDSAGRINVAEIAAPVTVAAIRDSVTVGQIVSPVTVATILDSVTVGQIVSPVTVATILDSVTVGQIVSPVTVATILDSVTVGQIVNPVTVSTVQSRTFSEVEALAQSTADTPSFFTTQTSSFDKYTFMVHNTHATNAATARVEISADGTDWLVDVLDTRIDPLNISAFVPNRFLKYTRLAYYSTTPGNAASLDIFFNAQV